METERNDAKTVSSRTSRCIACLEPINQGASICPSCGSSQSRFHRFSPALKWIGGITAVLSLVMLATQVQGLISQWQRTQEAVQERVEGARLQQEMGDLIGALREVSGALELDPTSSDARAFQVELVLSYLQETNAIAEDAKPFERYDQVVEENKDLINILYRGAASADGDRKATLMAFLGWLNILRLRSGLEDIDPDQHFSYALKLDPDNLYANLMWAAWIPNRYNPNSYDEQAGMARSMFALALEVAGDKRRWVREMQVHAYRNRQHELLRIGLDMHRHGEFQDIRNYPIGPFLDLISQDHLRERAWTELNESFTSDELVQITDWLLSTLPPLGQEDMRRQVQNKYREALLVAQGRLRQAQGKHSEALNRYLLAQGLFIARSRFNNGMRYAAREFGDVIVELIRDVATAQGIGTNTALVSFGRSHISTAHEAGLKDGDVILRINDKDLHHQATLPDTDAEGTVNAQILRDGKIVPLRFSSLDHGISVREIEVVPELWSRDISAARLEALYFQWVDPNSRP